MEIDRQLSIIIPTRNEAKIIGETIQQFTPFFEKYGLEIIISDAGSTDGTAEIVRRFSKKFPGRVIFVQKTGKQNIAIGRNFGAKHATGDILFHTDADVRIPQPDHFFETIFEKFSDPKVSAATSKLQIYPAEATATDRFYHFLMNTTIRFCIHLGWAISKGECQIVRRAAFEKIGGYHEKLVAGEDCDLFFRLQKTGRVVFLSKIEVQHSPRRFRELGYWKVSYQYFMEGISRLFWGKSFAQEWKVVR